MICKQCEEPIERDHPIIPYEDGTVKHAYCSPRKIQEGIKTFKNRDMLYYQPKNMSKR
jgi:hypothetical protein